MTLEELKVNNSPSFTFPDDCLTTRPLFEASATSSDEEEDGENSREFQNASFGVTHFDLLPPDIPNVIKVIFLVAYVTIIAVAVGGNGLVILVVGVHQRMKTVTNVFLVSLSVSDTMIALLNMPFQLQFYLRNEWTMGEALCKLTNYVQGVVVVSTILTLTGISMDRYYAICHPLKAKNLHTIRRACVLVSVFWIVSLVLVCPQLIVQRLEPLLDIHLDQSTPVARIAYVCVEYFPDGRLEFAYSLFFYVILYIIPLIAMFCAYGSIVRRLWRSAEPPGDAALHAGRKRRWSERKRTVRMLVVIVVLFAISWFPFFTSQLCRQFISSNSEAGDDEEVERHSLRIVMAFLHLLAYSNSCINPVIYCFLSDNFRKHFRKTLSCQFDGAMKRRHQHQFQRSMSSDRDLGTEHSSVITSMSNVQQFIDLEEFKDYRQRAEPSQKRKHPI